MKKIKFILAALLISTAMFSQVGINTDTPSATLDIVSTQSTAPAKALEVNNSNGLELFTVSAGGNVGINNSDPTNTLTVGATDGSRSGHIFVNPGNTTNVGGRITLASSVQRGGPNAVFENFGGDGSANNVPRVRINSQGLTPERFSVIHSTGYVGIGESTPLTRLHVNGYVKLGSTDATADASVAADREGAIRYTTAGGLQYHDATSWVSLAGTSGSSAADTTVDAWVNDATNNIVKLATLADGTTTRSDNAQVVVSNAGFLGVGNANPNTTLTVGMPDGTTGGHVYINPANATTIGGRVTLVSSVQYGGPNAVFENFGGDGSANNVPRLRINSQGITPERFTVVHSTGNVGVGQSFPVAKLDVQGYVKLRSTDATADATTAAQREGMVRYNATNGLQYHDATNWVTLAGTSGSSAADTTVDAFVNDATNTMVNLGTLADGTTARPAGSEFFIMDNGRVGIGVSTATNKLTLRGSGFVNASISFHNSTSSNTNTGQFGMRVYPGGGTPFTYFGFLFNGVTSDNSDAMGIYQTGVKIGGGYLSLPNVKLDVRGYIKIGSTDALSDATTAAQREGVIRYTSTDGLQYHNATSWVSLASTSTADLSKDAWGNDATNTMIKLETLADGTTARPAGTGFVVKDDGKVGIGTEVPSATLNIVSSSSTAPAKALEVDNSTGLEMFTVSAGGNVGINNSDPTNTLTVGAVDGTRPGHIHVNPANTTNVGGRISLASSISFPSPTIVMDNFGGSASATNTPRFRFISSGNEWFSVRHSNGNVGIGATHPTEKLEVNGAIKIGTTTSTCDAAAAGSIRWDGTNFQGCNGTAWTNL